MNVNQSKINIEYREILNKVFGNQITLADKYLNSKAVIKHHCKECKSNFYARPLWLVNNRQTHECYARHTKASKEIHSKIPIDRTKKVTKAMKLEIVQLYLEGFKISDIRKKLNLAHKTVDYHLKKIGVK